MQYFRRILQNPLQYCRPKSLSEIRIPSEAISISKSKICQTKDIIEYVAIRLRNAMPSQ